MGFLKRLFDGEYGLCWVNVSKYFEARNKGYDHLEALLWMAKLRYFDSEYNVNTAFEFINESLAPDSSEEEEDVRKLIHMMFVIECGVPQEYEVIRRLDRYLDEALAVQCRKHPGILRP